MITDKQLEAYKYKYLEKLKAAETRELIIKYLGGRCGNCGFDDIRALQIDHVDGGGKKDIMKHHYYKYLKLVLASVLRRENKYQVLCANCNWIKRHTHLESASSYTHLLHFCA